MKLSRKVVTRALTLVATGGVVLGMAATAFAVTPPYEPDTTNQLGQILFYDASGTLVTTGSTTAALPQFAVATTNDPVLANTSATLYGYTPVSGQPAPLWSGEQLSGTTTFPVASPANVAAAGLHRPVVTTTGSLTLADLIADFPNTNAAGSGYEGLYQLRILTAGNTQWWAADLQVTGTTWTLAYVTPAASTTTLTATPPSPQTAPASAITLTATVTNNAAGSVVFTDTTGAPTQVGSTQTLPGTGGGTNQVSVNIPAGLGVGTHTYTAAYTPAVGALFTGSSGPLTYQVNATPADSTSTSLSFTLPVTVGDTFTMSSHVADTTVPATTPVGTVTWKDGATTIAGPTAVDASGNASAGPSAFGLGSGSHSIVAIFTPTNPATFNASQSAPIAFSLSPAAGDPCTNGGAYPSDTRTNVCIDDQTVVTTVPRGNLFISTPYTPANPFDLGTMQLSPNGTTLHTSAPFGSAAAPASGVTIIDTRSAGEGWTAAVKSNDFTSGTNSINACNLGFTGVTPSYISGNAIDGVAKIVTTTNVPNGGAPGMAAGAACSTGLAGSAPGHTFASLATNGTGSVYVYGLMDLYAPTSTPAGLYAATVTFTIF
jgi:hypothetical protein